jgi:hypothetical protein
MRSAPITTNGRILCIVLIISALSVFQAGAQENSPYSKYGIGDVLPQTNVLNRGMGGLSLAYWDVQSINFNNPASYARLKLTTFDVGLEYAGRTLRATNTTNAYTSRNLLPTYLNIGVPLSKKKSWGMNFGFRPVTRINYDIVNNSRLPGIDSVSYRYYGTGGSYQAFVGVGGGTRNLSFGINAGYMFGNKHYGTQMSFVNDTVRYQKANYTDSTSFGGLFVKAGVQYQKVLSGDMNLKFGATFGLQNKMNALRDVTRQTYEGSGRGPIVVDSIYRVAGEKGEVVMPGSWGAGVSLERMDKWQVGIEYNAVQWADYSYYGQKDQLRNNWAFRIGGQLIPSINSSNYWSRIAYRGGFSFGPDHINTGTSQRVWTASFGMGMPVRRNFYTNQYTTVNLAIELGQRGNKSDPIRENFFRVALGFNLSDIWFNKRQYN